MGMHGRGSSSVPARPMRASVKQGDSSAPLTTRALDYEGRIADLRAKIHELEESRSVLATLLRDLETKEGRIEHIHQSWLAVIDAILDPIFMHDRDGRIMRANRAYAELAGMDIKDVIGRLYWQVFPRHGGPLPGFEPILADKQDMTEEERTFDNGRTYRCRMFVVHGQQRQHSHSLHVMQDITERKHMVEALRRERDFNVAVMETLGALVAVFDRDGNVVQFNRACQTATGYTPDEIIGKPIWDVLLTAEEREPVRTVFENLNHGQFPNVHENYWVARDGRQRLIRWSNTVLTDENGGIRYILATGIDITERKAAEDALRDSETRFRTMIEYSSDITAILNPDGTIRYTSPSIERLLGYGQEELLGRNAFTLIHADDLTSVQHTVARAMENPGQAQHALFRFRDKDNTWRYLDAFGKYLREDSPMSGIVVNARDITARKQAEDKLRESELWFRSLVETTNDWVWEVDENTRYTYVSPRVHNLLGYAPDELIGKTPFDLMPPDEARRVKETFQSFAARHQPFTGLENTNLHKDGHPVVLETNGVPHFDETGAFRGYRGIDRDITGRKQAERTLHKINRALKTLSACNESLVHALDEQELLTAICQVLVSTGGYQFAWVGYPDHDQEKTVQPRAHAGTGADFLRLLRFGWGDDENGRNPIGEAIRSGRPRGVHDIQKSPESLRPRQEALNHGFLSCIALPLRDGGSTLGVLAIYAAEADAFDDHETKLLMELADDLTYGIVALRTRHERERAMEENRQNTARMESALLETIDAMSSALEKRDPYTAGHQRQVAKLAHAIAQEMKLPQKTVEGIYMGGLIHDIGKIYVPAEILSRPGHLSEVEFNLIKTHPQVGYEIIKGIEFPWPVAHMILEHHERLDGSGYPQGLKADEISLEARILAVADTVEAMASHRPYRPALGLDKALDEIRKNRGTLYDPTAADACLRLFTEKGFKFDE